MNILDSRDLLKEKEQLGDDLSALESEMDDLQEEMGDLLGDDDYSVEEAEELLEKVEDKEKEIQEWKDEHQERLDDLTQCLENLPEDPRDGCTLIHEADFVEYTQDLLEDCGYISHDFPHWIVIDWEATADNVKMDCTAVELDGETYFVR